MSATRTSAPTAAGAARPAGFVRRHRGALVIGTGLLIAVVFSILGNAGGTHSGLDDPQNPQPEGSRALARVLEREGIDVRIVRGAAAFDRTRLDQDTTVVVTSTENLGASTVRRFRAHAGPAEVVLVEPRYGVARLFGASDSAPVVDRTRTTGRCGDPRFTDLRIDVVEATAYPAGTLNCFPTEAGPLLVGSSTSLVLFGSGDLISNQHITRADNAAVALRLFGARKHLVWYVPDVRDLAAGDGVTLGSLLPRWLRPAMVLGVVALLALFWWRGWRLGKLAIEPLPVAITAIESTRSRARLYRKVNDRDHAARALRRAARRRLAEQLRLPRRTAEDVAALARDLAPYTRTDHARLVALLGDAGPAPATDTDLNRLANDLADLMREVREA